MAVILEFPKVQRAKRKASQGTRSKKPGEILLFTGVRYEREEFFDDDVLFEDTAANKVRQGRD